MNFNDSWHRFLHCITSFGQVLLISCFKTLSFNGQYLKVSAVAPTLQWHPKSTKWCQSYIIFCFLAALCCAPETALASGIVFRRSWAPFSQLFDDLGISPNLQGLFACLSMLLAPTFEPKIARPAPHPLIKLLQQICPKSAQICKKLSEIKCDHTIRSHFGSSHLLLLPPLPRG